MYQLLLESVGGALLLHDDQRKRSRVKREKRREAAAAKDFVNIPLGPVFPKLTLMFESPGFH